MTSQDKDDEIARHVQKCRSLTTLVVDEPALSGTVLRRVWTRRFVFGVLIFDRVQIVNPDLGLATTVDHDWKA